MAAVTICSDFRAPKIKFDTLSTVSPSISHEVKGPGLSSLNVELYAIFHSSLSLSSRGFLVLLQA